jgi:hypothetical protein
MLPYNITRRELKPRGLFPGMALNYRAGLKISCLELGHMNPRPRKKCCLLLGEARRKFSLLVQSCTFVTEPLRQQQPPLASTLSIRETGGIILFLFFSLSVHHLEQVTLFVCTTHQTHRSHQRGSAATHYLLLVWGKMNIAIMNPVRSAKTHKAAVSPLYISAG